jgi:hypothetical protein
MPALLGLPLALAPLLAALKRILLQDNTAAGVIRCLANSPTPTASGNTASSINEECGQT